MSHAERSGADSRKIRVLHVIHSLHPGGAENVVRTLATSLDPERFEVEVCGLTEGGVVAEQLREAGVPVFVLGKKPGLDLSLIPRLRRRIKDGNYSIIHAHNPPGNHWTVLASCLLRGAPPVVLTEHSPQYPGRIASWYPLVRGFLTLRDRAIVGVCQAVTDSHRRLDPLSRGRYRTIYIGIDGFGNGVPPSDAGLRAELGLSPGTVVIGTVGNLRSPKAHDVLLQAVDALTEHYPQLHVVIIGDGPLRDELVRQTRALNLDDRVHWLGRRTDIGRCLGAMDLFVLSSRREGFPLAVLEAISAGIPVVATDVGGVREVIHDGKTGRLVASEDPSALAAAIAAQIDDRTGAQGMARQAREVFERCFTTRTMVQRTEALYEEFAR